MNRSYAALAATLRDLGDRMAALADHPTLDGTPDPRLSLSVHPAPAGTAADAHQAWVDVIAAALAGDTPATAHRQPCSRGGEIYARRARLGRISLGVQAVVPDPEEEEGLRAEVARLRAELAAEVRAAHGGRLTTAEGAREVLDAGGEVRRDERYTGDYRYIVTREPGDPQPEALGDVGRCPSCGGQSRSYSRGCSSCGHGADRQADADREDGAR